MELVKGSASIVLRGIWNPAILGPDWLAKYAFGKKENEQVAVTIEYPTVPDLPLRINMENMLIMPGRSRVIIAVPGAVNDAELNRVEVVSQAILAQLPHTPMQAVGQNFEFVEEAPTAEQVEIFANSSDLPDKCDFAFDTQQSTLRSSITFEGRTLNLTRTFFAAGG